MTHYQFSKTSASYLRHKAEFLEKNKQNLENIDKINALYKKQPLRTRCKNCETPFPDPCSADFTSHGITYYFCRTCDHLNGMHQDTEAFARAIYADNDTIKYHETYTRDEAEAFQTRVEDIYLPKVDFLVETIKKSDPDTEMAVLDIGSGAGHFAEALRRRGIKVRGLEISASAVNTGNEIMGEKILRCVQYDALLDGIANTSAPIASMIGVLEHLTSPRKIFEILNKNKNIKYIYLVLPVVSLAVFLEMFFQNSFNRVLGGGHTHLYSRKSITYFLHEFEFESVAEWWFGADIPDLIRFGQIELSRLSGSAHVSNLWESKSRNFCDKLQAVIDREHFCSEIHLIAKKSV